MKVFLNIDAVFAFIDKKHRRHESAVELVKKLTQKQSQIYLLDSFLLAASNSIEDKKATEHFISMAKSKFFIVMSENSLVAEASQFEEFDIETAIALVAAKKAECEFFYTDEEIANSPIKIERI